MESPRQDQHAEDPPPAPPDPPEAGSDPEADDVDAALDELGGEEGVSAG